MLYLLFLSIAQALFYQEQWGGTFGWGLRFMLPALPALFVLLAPIIDRHSVLRQRTPLALLIFVSVAVQVAGAVVDWNLPYVQLDERGLAPFSAASAWEPQYSSIPFQLQALFDSSRWSTAWVRMLQGGSSSALIVPLTAIALIGILSLQPLKLARPAARRAWIFHATVIGAAFLLPLGLATQAYEEDLYWKGNGPHQAMVPRFTAQQMQEGDVVILDAYGTRPWYIWLNQWDRPEPWYSLPFEIPSADPTSQPISSEPSAAALQLLERLPADHRRLWYVATSDAPDFALAREVNWLNQRYERLDAWEFDGNPETQITLYCLTRQCNS